jgi:hypothetical protein
VIRDASRHENDGESGWRRAENVEGFHPMAAFLTDIRIRPSLAGLCVLAGLILQLPAATIATIAAVGETDLPADTPSGRLDTEGTFSFVGALAISSARQNSRIRSGSLDQVPDWLP